MYGFVRSAFASVVAIVIIPAVAWSGTFRWQAAQIDQDRAKGLTSYMSALLHENDGELGEAIKQYKEALRFSPNEVPIYLNLGVVYLKKQSYREARRIFAKAMYYSHNDPRPRFLLAFAYLLENHQGVAQHLFERNLEIDATHLPTLSMLGDLYLLKKKDAQAQAIYEKMISLDGATSRVYYNLGVIYLNQNKLEEARENFQHVLQYNPQSLRSLMALASVYNLKGNIQEAIRLYEDILLLVPPNRVISNELVYLYEQAGQYDKAKDFQERLINMGGATLQDYFKLGILCLRSGKPKEAVKHFRFVREKSEPGYESALFLGLAYEAAALYDEAMPYFEEALSFSPEDDLVFLRIGIIYDQRGMLKKAEKYIRQAIKINPNNDVALNYLAYTFAEKEIKLDEAEDLIQRALKIDPDNGAYVDTLGWVYFQKKKYKKALEYLLIANEKIPGDVEILSHIAKCYESLHNKKKALETWKVILTIDSNHPEAKSKVSS